MLSGYALSTSIAGVVLSGQREQPDQLDARGPRPLRRFGLFDRGGEPGDRGRHVDTRLGHTELQRHRRPDVVGHRRRQGTTQVGRRGVRTATRRRVPGGVPQDGRRPWPRQPATGEDVRCHVPGRGSGGVQQPGRPPVYRLRLGESGLVRDDVAEQRRREAERFAAAAHQSHPNEGAEGVGDRGPVEAAEGDDPVHGGRRVQQRDRLDDGERVRGDPAQPRPDRRAECGRYHTVQLLDGAGHGQRARLRQRFGQAGQQQRVATGQGLAGGHERRVRRRAQVLFDERGHRDRPERGRP